MGDRLATIDMSRKERGGAAVPLSVGGSGSPSNTMWDGMGTSSPPQTGHRSPNVRPMSVVAKRLHKSRCHLVRR